MGLQIKIHNPSKLATIDYRQTQPFQGTLKELTRANHGKLVNSLKEHGFFVPLYLWQHEGVWWTIDGHQRVLVMLAEDVHDKGGVYQVPYVIIEAKNIQEAKKKLLVISSQYGKTTLAGFDEFTSDLEPEWIAGNTHFDTLPVAYFEGTGFDKPVKEPGAGVKSTALVLGDEELGHLEQLAGYKTSILRTKLSEPMARYKAKGLLTGEVLDYGCGQDKHNYVKFDPAFYPKYDLLNRQYDTVCCNYVINVIPLDHNKAELCLVLRGLVKPGGQILMAVYSKAENDTFTTEGYQCGWKDGQWQDFLKQFFTVERIPGSELCYILKHQ